MVNIDRIKNINSLMEFEYDFIFHGQNVDERSAFVFSEAFSLGCELVETKYDHNTYTLKLGDEEHLVNSLHDFFSSLKGKCVLVDLTTLEFPEILYIFHWLNSCCKGDRISALYIEPKEYKKVDIQTSEYDEYALSDFRQTFSGLPLYSAFNPKTKVKSSLVAFMGFEGSRLGQIVEQDDRATYRETIACLGIPATTPGWENHSLANHFRFLESNISVLDYYSCKNAYSNIKLLNDFYCHKDNITIAALGTKPSSLACAMFLINNFPDNTKHRTVSTIYDFPKLTQGRSKGIGKKYLFEIFIDNY